MCRSKLILNIESLNLILGKALNVNLKVNQLKDLDYMNYCANCSKKNFCIEGIAEMRLTPSLKLTPCILCNDNCLQLSDCGKYDADRVKKFFQFI